jgi:hypothetical protein
MHTVLSEHRIADAALRPGQITVTHAITTPIVVSTGPILQASA